MGLPPSRNLDPAIGLRPSSRADIFPNWITRQNIVPVSFSSDFRPPADCQNDKAESWCARRMCSQTLGLTHAATRGTPFAMMRVRFADEGVVREVCDEHHGEFQQIMSMLP
jgi:hypothetical protein